MDAVTRVLILTEIIFISHKPNTFVAEEFGIYTLEVISILPTIKVFISHPESVIFNETSYAS